VLRPNPALARLGFGPADRALILHADDLGMCEATVAAFAQLAEREAPVSFSLMAPCPWFFAAAALCRGHPHVDVGMHLTLTSEWPGYRWGPVSTREAATGLLDEEGCFHRRSEAVQCRADPAAAAAEMRAQVVRSRAADLEVSHLDSHMFAALSAPFLPAYLALAREAVLPALLWRTGPHAHSTVKAPAALTEELLCECEAAGMPVFDHVAALWLGEPEDRWRQLDQALTVLPPGLSLLILHPAADTAELRRITPDWRSRAADLRVLTDRRLPGLLRGRGIEVLSYRTLRGTPS
jgi:predicted glycoside hydrolase/deacetylase ChbG (UPF0249 family)